MNTKKLAVVGFGPGDKRHMTIEAVDAIAAADIVVGYTTYIDLIRGQFPDKDLRSTGMGGEKERVAMALRLADEGNNVTLVCSGDSSLYGMSALTYEIADQYPEVDITIIPGITAALSASALLGAVIGNDFCTISLSDYHTSREEIMKRLKAAASCDFVIALYNSRSSKRPDSLREACDELLTVIPGDRICGVARNIGREQEESFIMPLSELRDFAAGMFDTILIGSSKTVQLNGRMVTPRGYRLG